MIFYTQARAPEIRTRLVPIVYAPGHQDDDNSAVRYVLRIMATGREPSTSILVRQHAGAREREGHWQCGYLSPSSSASTASSSHPAVGPRTPMARFATAVGR